MQLQERRCVQEGTDFHLITDRPQLAQGVPDRGLTRQAPPPLEEEHDRYLYVNLRPQFSHLRPDIGQASSPSHYATRSMPRAHYGYVRSRLRFWAPSEYAAVVGRLEQQLKDMGQETQLEGGALFEDV